MSCLFLRRAFNVLFLTAIILVASTKPSQGQTTGGTGASDTTASGSAEQFRFFGTVVQENGTPAPIGTAIELDCGNTLTRVAEANPTGQYEFLLGDSDRSRKLQPDAISWK
jgi:hypothetical protein